MLNFRRYLKPYPVHLMVWYQYKRTGAVQPMPHVGGFFDIVDEIGVLEDRIDHDGSLNLIFIVGYKNSVSCPCRPRQRLFCGSIDGL